MSFWSCSFLCHSLCKKTCSKCKYVKICKTFMHKNLTPDVQMQIVTSDVFVVLNVVSPIIPIIDPLCPRRAIFH